MKTLVKSAAMFFIGMEVGTSRFILRFYLQEISALSHSGECSVETRPRILSIVWRVVFTLVIGRVWFHWLPSCW